MGKDWNQMTASDHIIRIQKPICLITIWGGLMRGNEVISAENQTYIGPHADTTIQRDIPLYVQWILESPEESV